MLNLSEEPESKSFAENVTFWIGSSLKAFIFFVVPYLAVTLGSPTDGIARIFHFLSTWKHKTVQLSFSVPFFCPLERKRTYLLIFSNLPLAGFEPRPQTSAPSIAPSPLGPHVLKNCNIVCCYCFFVMCQLSFSSMLSFLRR